MASLPRKPVVLPQHVEGGDNSCIVAMVQYVFGHSRTPDPYEVDRDTRRRGAASLDDFDAACYLMKASFQCEVITFDTDEAMLEHGLLHLRRLYAAEWSPTMGRYYNNQRVGLLKRAAQRNISRKRLYGTQYSQIERNASPKDVKRHLQLGHAVSFMATSPRGELTDERALLVPDENRHFAWLYVPRMGSAARIPGRSSVDVLSGRVRYDRPVIAFWR